MIEQVRRLGFALVLAVSLPVLFSPASAVPTTPPGTDKLVHLVLFAALGYTAVLAGLPPRVAGLWLAAYATISELLQALPALGRSSDLLDWTVDLLGLVLGLLVAGALRRTGRWWAPARGRP